MDINAVVYLNHGRWVAHCPRPGCFNAEQFGQCDDTTIGGLTGQSFQCRRSHGGCGLRCPSVWPDNLEDIEALVMVRPIPSSRNWVPGEDMKELLTENLAHGLYPNDNLELLGPRILGGARLAPSFSRFEIGV